MKVEVQKSFEKDMRKVSDKDLAAKVLIVISQLEDFQMLSEVPHLKKLKQKGNYYRIRIGNHRLGLKVIKDVIVLIRFLDRKDIYNYFP
jgi:mRNA interferase RelE/StbE